jgi:D-alanine--poly(phosphoribitol) ligase subunit 1
MKSRIINSLIWRIRNSSNNALIYLSEDKLVCVTNYDFIKKIFILYENFIKIKTHNIILPGEKNEFCLEAIYAAVLADKTFINLNLNQTKKRLEEIIEQFSDYKYFSTSDIQAVIKESQLNQKDFFIEDIIPILNKLKFKKQIQNNFAYIMFTSGSTGKPKGVIISNKSLKIFMEYVHKILVENMNLFLKEQLSLSPFYFDNFIFDLVFFNENRGCIYLIDIKILINQEKLDKIIGLKYLLKRINFIYAAPSIIKILITNNFFNQISLKNSNDIFVGFGGEPFSWSSAKDLITQLSKNSKIINFYGPTECTCMCSLFEINIQNFDDQRKLHEKFSSLIPIGELFSYFDFLIKGREIYSKDLSNGELLLTGVGLMEGYLDNVNFKFIFNNGKKYYNTGDIISTNNGNLFYIHGRKDNQIKIKGNRIEIEEIENRIRYIIKKSNLIIVDIEDRGITRLILVLAINQNIYNFKKSLKRISEEKNMILLLRKNLPSVMAISDILSSSNLPLNANGKLDRKFIKDTVKNYILV